MLKHLLCAILLAPIALIAQDSLFVKLQPKGDFNQLSMYKIDGAHQSYIANAKSEEGNFNFEFPENSSPGMYRLFFDLQNGGFFEVLYNKETIEVTFDPSMPDDTAVFTQSDENKVYQTYIQQIGLQQYTLDSLQYAYFNAPIKTDLKEMYPAELQKLYELQEGFEKNAVGLMALHFIRANEKYYRPEIIENLEDYLQSTQEHYFDYVDFSNAQLTRSSFLIDKVIEYVFYMNTSDDATVDTQLKMQVISKAMTKIGANYQVKDEIISSLMYAFAQQQTIDMVSFVKERFYEKLPAEFIDERFISQINGMIKAAVGTTAPEITWDENGETQKLSELNMAENYLVVFWSTSCSHCLEEIPKLYEFTKNLDDIKVIAVALEEEAVAFKNQTKTMTNWINVLGLNKWENEIARSYDINATPSYFILDKEKRIIAKPEELEDVVLYISN